MQGGPQARLHRSTDAAGCRDHAGWRRCAATREATGLGSGIDDDGEQTQLAPCETGKNVEKKDKKKDKDAKDTAAIQSRVLRQWAAIAPGQSRLTWISLSIPAAR